MWPHVHTHTKLLHKQIHNVKAPDCDVCSRRRAWKFSEFLSEHPVYSRAHKGTTHTNTNVYRGGYTRWGDLILVYVQYKEVRFCPAMLEEANKSGSPCRRWYVPLLGLWHIKEDLKTLIYTALALRLERRPQITYPCPPYRLSVFRDVSLTFSQFSFSLPPGIVPPLDLHSSASFFAYITGAGVLLIFTKRITR
jgi:hypothetical protein